MGGHTRQQHGTQDDHYEQDDDHWEPFDDLFSPLFNQQQPQQQQHDDSLANLGVAPSHMFDSELLSCFPYAGHAVDIGAMESNSRALPRQFQIPPDVIARNWENEHILKKGAR